MSFWNKMFGKNKKKDAAMDELDKIFSETEEMLSKMESGSCCNIMNHELIDLMMSMIYRSSIISFINSVNNSFFKDKTMPMKYYNVVKPLLTRWKNVLDCGTILNQQSFFDFLNDLNNFSTNYPDFLVGESNSGIDELTLAGFFQVGIWEPYFKSAEKKAKEFCKRMRRLLESKGNFIEKLINSGYSVITPFEFEELIAKLFIRMGFDVKVTSKTGDYGIDIIARKGSDVIAVQTKKYADGNNVGNRDVQRLLGAMQLRTVRANKAILITTSDFTFQAAEQAKETPLELWDGKYISSLLRKYMA